MLGGGPHGGVHVLMKTPESCPPCERGKNSASAHQGGAPWTQPCTPTLDPSLQTVGNGRPLLTPPVCASVGVAGAETTPQPGSSRSPEPQFLSQWDSHKF